MYNNILVFNPDGIFRGSSYSGGLDPLPKIRLGNVRNVELGM